MPGTSDGVIWQMSILRGLGPVQIYPVDGAGQEDRPHLVWEMTLPLFFTISARSQRLVIFTPGGYSLQLSSSSMYLRAVELPGIGPHLDSAGSQLSQELFGIV